MMDTIRLWVVFNVVSFDSVRAADGRHLRLPKTDPQAFLPVFDTKDQAVKWNGGKEHNVVEIEPVEHKGETNEP